MSCSTNASRSAGASVSSTTCSASPAESASNTSSSGLVPSARLMTGSGTCTPMGVRGGTRPLTFPAKVAVVNSGEVWLNAEIQVNRADFGLTWNLMGMTSMQNTITVNAVFAKR
jgi:YceI-like protein